MSDSRIGTYEHRARVQELLGLIISDLLERSRVHDESKLHPPEKEAFDRIESIASQVPYGSEEYRAVLRNEKPAIQHHYENNSHHPEFSHGILGMSLIDIIEMVVDWMAASERSRNDVLESLPNNAKRFEINPQLTGILSNTILDIRDMELQKAKASW